MSRGEIEGALKSLILARIRPACLRLVELPTQGNEAQEVAILVLKSLQNMLEQLPQVALEASMQYVLFPLFLLTDSAVALRTKNPSFPDNKSPLIVSDKLAEGVTRCLEFVLRKCPATDTSMMKNFMRSLVGAALMKPGQASEEFRLGILRCLKAVFESLVRCGEDECCCRASLSSEESILSSLKTREEKPLVVGENCVLGYVQSEEMSATIGHLLSLLLQISRVEVEEGAQGSGSIRAESISLLRVVMRKVGNANALAFFLPGTASGLGKTILLARVSRKRSSFNSVPQFCSVGAAGNSRSIQEAIRATAELLVLVLADPRNSKALDSPAESPLEGILNSFQRKPDAQSRQNVSEEKKAEGNEKRVLRVDRNEDWLRETVPRVKLLLAEILPALCSHPSASVRIAVAESSGEILAACQETLKPCMPSVLESLLFLTVDESKAVSEAASRSLALSSPSSKLQDPLFELLSRLVEDMPKLVFAADENPALLHARRLTAAMYFAGPEGVYNSLLQSPASISRFVTIMKQSLSLPSAFSSSFAQIASESYTFTGIVECSEPEVAADQLPRRAPWFLQAGKSKLYDSLATIIRLAGFSSLSGSQRQRLSDLLAHLLNDIRDSAATENQLSTGAGAAKRSASTAACIVNEMIYGASGLWFTRSFSSDQTLLHRSWGEAVAPEVLRSIIKQVLHDYMAPELWELPVDPSFVSSGSVEPEVNLAHVLQDNSTLQQMFVEGAGVFGLVLGDAFERTGFLGLVIYPLLEKLGSSSYPVSHSASISLSTISSSCGYDSVRKLVVANLDHVIDSLCRELRHIIMYPHAPNLLTAILQQTGAAGDMLPLLEEPVRGLLLELEIAGRHHHPHLTIPILKALREITRAARLWSFELEASASQTMNEPEIDALVEQKGCLRSVSSVASSCVLAAAPLLASKDIRVVTPALDVVEEGISALAKVQAAFRANLEKWQRAVEAQNIENKDGELVEEDPNEKNKVQMTMHEVWPHLVNCLKQKNPAIVSKCLNTLAILSRQCGGKFLTRRLRDETQLFFRLLRDGAVCSGVDRLAVRAGAGASQELQDSSSSPSSSGRIRVQEAALRCIKTVSEDHRSSPALELVLEKISSMVVGLACSRSNSSLRELACETAVALSSIDSDLVWIQAADLAYGHPGSRVEPRLPSTSCGATSLPACSEILPSFSSPNEALCCQFSGYDFRHQLDPQCALQLVSKLEASLYRKENKK